MTEVLQPLAPEEPAAERDDGRDERGRFAPARTEEPAQAEPQSPEEPSQAVPEPAPQPPQPQQAQPDPGRPPSGYVPQEALHAARQQVDEWQRRAFEFEREMADIRRQVEAAKPKPEAPQFWEAPEEYIKRALESHIKPVQQSNEAVREQVSRMIAVSEIRSDLKCDLASAEAKMMEAQNDFERLVRSDPQANRHLYDRVAKSSQPYSELVKWHKEQATLSRVGNDPEAYINAEVERRLAERASQQQQHPQAHATRGDPTQGLPQSFAAARNDGPRSASQAFSGPRTLRDIMGR